MHNTCILKHIISYHIISHIYIYIHIYIYALHNHILKNAKSTLLGVKTRFWFGLTNDSFWRRFFSSVFRGCLLVFTWHYGVWKGWQNQVCRKASCRVHNLVLAAFSGQPNLSKLVNGYGITRYMYVVYIYIEMDNICMHTCNYYVYNVLYI